MRIYEYSSDVIKTQVDYYMKNSSEFSSFKKNNSRVQKMNYTQLLMLKEMGILANASAGISILSGNV